MKTQKPLRVAIIGHITPDPNEIDIPTDEQEIQNMLKIHNFTRVVTQDGKLSDHLAYLKRFKGLAKSEKFTVWEMYLCASLLLGSYLERNGFEVKFLNYIDSDSEEEAFEELRCFDPDVVVLSTTFVLSRSHLVKAGQCIRKALPGTFIVAGGHHVFTTLMYMSPEQQNQYLLSTEIDAFVNDSQGEQALLRLCQNFPKKLHLVANLIWREKNGSIIHNKRLPENNDINETLIDFHRIPEASTVHIRTARSCTFKCSFCSYPTTAGALALMEIDNVMATLQKCKEKNVASVFFVDDTFNVPRPRFEALIDRMIQERFNIPWYSFLRCQFVDKELVKKMRRSGCAGVFIGVESGSDQILKNMKKGAVSQFYRDGVRWLQDEGIITVGSFIIGFPGETDETVYETRQFIQDSGLEYYFIQPFYYLHHSPIHKQSEKYGLKGKGLFWLHNTMNVHEAIEHINRLFLEIKNPIWVNPDYTLWEIAYLQNKGMNLEQINDYRVMINKMTADQMVKYGIASGNVTSREMKQHSILPTIR